MIMLQFCTSQFKLVLLLISLTLIHEILSNLLSYLSYLSFYVVSQCVWFSSEVENAKVIYLKGMQAHKGTKVI